MIIDLKTAIYLLTYRAQQHTIKHQIDNPQNTMITAAQCLELHKQSDAQIEKILNMIDPKVRSAAEGGMRSYSIMEQGTWECLPISKSPEHSPFRTKLINQFQQLGFVAAYQKSGAPYVPAGLADDDGKGPLHTNWGITISW